MLKVLFPILLAVGIAHGQENGVAGSYRDFSGGLNNFSASVSIAPNESPNLSNVVIDEPIGALTQRKGYTACGNTPSGATATALYEYSKNDGSRNLIVSDNNTIWQTGDCIIYSTIATNLGDLNLPRFATVQDNLWIVNGSTYPIVWNGATGYYLDGLSNRPLGPKGKLITYWKSRVWIGNTSTSPSGLYFSALVDTNGAILDPATSTMAWANALNLIYFNRDNGSPLYGIKVYRDNLYAFKENDILRLVFESEYTASGITVTKTVSKTGSKFQESIVEMDDGLLRFVGRDGVYVFDGSMVKRISTKWSPTFYTIKQPTHGEQYALWDSASDWLAGTLDINSSTSVVVGSLTNGYEDFADLNYSANPVWTVADGTFSASTGKLAASVNGHVYTQSTKYTGTFEFDLIMGPTISANRLSIMSNSTIANITNANAPYPAYMVVTGPYDANNLQAAMYGWSPASQAICVIQIPTASFYNTTHHIKVVRTGQNFELNFGAYSCSGSATLNMSSSTYSVMALGAGNSVDNFSWIYKSTSVFSSQISTATGLTLWKTFDVDQTAPANTSIAYQMRVATSVYNLGLAPFSTIVPGSIISTTTNGYCQWKANLSTMDSSVTPILNSASAGWVTGDSSKSPLTAIGYKSRYWMSSSVGLTNQYNDMTMVESKSPLMTYTKYDLPLSAMTLWNDKLYGAIGNTAKIVRVDYGDTDDGTTITSYWDSRDELFENPILYKSVNRVIADFSATPDNSNVQIGLSPDLGGTWEYKSVDTNSNSLLPRNTSVLNFSANNALQFRSRIYNTTPGVGFTFYGIHPIGTKGSFMGNN